MKTTLELPDELMRQAKVRAAMEGRKLKDVVAEALKTGLLLTAAADRPSKGIRVEADPETGLPVVAAVTDAPGAALTREEIVRLGQDSHYVEDLQRAGLSL